MAFNKYLQIQCLSFLIMACRPKPLLLLILDGFGIEKKTANTALALAATPCWDSLKPIIALDCSDDAGGLAPAMLAILGIQPASEMIGLSLIGE
jgi:bisphosphoglycerate-independent phosphoglycerate mutase (AlkP superfamily)